MSKHRMLRAGVVALAREAGAEVVAESGEAARARVLVEEFVPDVLVFISDPLGSDAVDEFSHPERTLVLAFEADPALLRSTCGRRLGGYLLFSEAPARLSDALWGVAEGNGGWFSACATRALHTARPEAVLSERQREIVRLLAEGLSNDEIGDALHISSNTVKRHVTNVMARVGATSRAGAVAWAFRHGCVT